jgi:adenylate cyclase
MAGIFMSAAIFHLWGTKLLIDMYNGHLKIEAINRHGLSISVQSQSESSETKKSGRLTPERMLAAIMMTDMVGFSKEMETNEQDTYLKLLKHNEIIRKNILQNWGQEIKTIGDAFLVRFNSAVDAIKAAMNIQTEFSEYNRDKSRDDQIRIRIGIHIGDILIMGKDVIGNGVNIAARIEPLAEPGGICISADTYNMIKKSIDIKVLSLGKKELKNITDSPEIYKILLESIY